MRPALTTIALLTVARLACAAEAFPPIPKALIGANQGWSAKAAEVTDVVGSRIMEVWVLGPLSLVHRLRRSSGTQERHCARP